MNFLICSTRANRWLAASTPSWTAAITAGSSASSSSERPSSPCWAAHWGMKGAGVVLAQPTPEAFALSPDMLQPALREVEKLATQAGVRAKDLPPLMMDRLNRLTKGRALRAYRAILEANARLAARIARELPSLRSEPGKTRPADAPDADSPSME